MTYLLFAVSVILWMVLRSRLKELESAAGSYVTRQEFAALTRRVHALERSAMPAPAPAAVQVLAPMAVPAPESAPTPVPTLEPEPPPEPAPVFSQAPLPEPEPVMASAPFVSQPRPPQAPAPPPPPSWGERISTMVGGQEWEALLGGSLLNKAGAVLMVIGIALFLPYEFAHLGAAGRASISIAVSFAILGAGLWSERSARYRVFSRGVIGAGWAALYATSYAIYALPAARIIESPILGSLCMVGVATAMILHSLRYRSQAVTAVAYGSIFAALAATPSSPFAVASLIPVAISILYLGARFEWNWMPLFSLVATYVTCISRGESDSPLAAVKALFLAYWLIFELFDLLRVKRRLVAGGVEFLFPLNTLCFIGLSYVTWSHHAPERLWFASACGAALFWASSIARIFLYPRTDASPELFERLRAGCYEASLVVSAALAAMAIVGRTQGVWTGVGLGMEAEVLYLAGVRFDSTFVRRLGVLAFLLSLWNVVVEGMPGRQVPVLGYQVWEWTLPVAFEAVLFYFNRAIRNGGAGFSFAAAALVTAVLAAQMPGSSLGMAWALYGLVLLELGIIRRLGEFRLQGYALIAAGMVASAAHVSAYHHGPWAGLAVTLGIVYAISLQSRWAPHLEDRERKLLEYGGSFGTAALGALLIWRTLPVAYAGLAWAGLALLLFEVGIVRLPAGIRRCFGPLMLLAVCDVLIIHGDIGKYPPPATYLAYLGICLGAWLAAAQLTLWPPPDSDDWERSMLRDALTAVGLAAAMCTLWLVLPNEFVTAAWTLLAIALLEAARRVETPSLYWVALGGAAVTYCRIFAVDLYDVDLWMGMPHRMLIAPLFAASLYWFWRRFLESPVTRVLFWAPLPPLLWLAAAQAGMLDAALPWAVMAIALQVAGMRLQLNDARRQAQCLAVLAFATACFYDVDPARLSISISTAVCLYILQFAARRANEGRASLVFSVAATALTAALLYGRVSGGLLTLSWGLLGLTLLGAGFASRERILRLQGLFLLLTCILKLFLYDLRNLDTPYRILSFVGLGLILLSVSWIYTRFRAQMTRLL